MCIRDRDMSKIFKNMLPYWKGLIIVVALLVVQAWCDLSLPAYTSDIIDVGIQNKGVEHVLPEAVTEDEFTLAQLFMADEEKESWENSYEKDGDVYAFLNRRCPEYRPFCSRRERGPAKEGNEHFV